MVGLSTVLVPGVSLCDPGRLFEVVNAPDLLIGSITTRGGSGDGVGGGVVQKKKMTFLLRGSLVFVAQVCCARARVSACYFYVHSGLIIGMTRILVLD